jgi:hypothetical protein
VEGVQQIFDGKEDDDGGDGGEDPGNDEEDDLLQDDLEDPNKRPQDASGSGKKRDDGGDATPKPKKGCGQSGQKELYAKTIHTARKSIDKMIEEGGSKRD